MLSGLRSKKKIDYGLWPFLSGLFTFLLVSILGWLLGLVASLLTLRLNVSALGFNFLNYLSYCSLFRFGF